MRRLLVLVSTVALAIPVIFSGCHSKGIALEDLQGRFEDLGDVVGQAERCGVTTNRTEIGELLKKRAVEQGANDLEQESLLSYFNAAADQSAKTKGDACTADDKTRTSALLNDQLNQFKQ
jgi:hypothetical protein